MMKHVFAISAYKDSPYLEECILSLVTQTVPGDVIICTSTPNSHIRELAERYALPLYVREGKSSLRNDWNYAVSCAVRKHGAELVTIAHQDDVYHPGYREALLSACRRYPDILLFCTRYETIDASGKRIKGSIENVKRILRLPLRLRALSNRGFIKKLPLRFGNGICCPSCTYNTSLTGLPIFHGDYSFVTDWDALLRLSEKPGRFICDERELISYRVHEGAATSRLTKGHLRSREEYQMFCRMWPRPIASLILIPYGKSYDMYK